MKSFGVKGHCKIPVLYVTLGVNPHPNYTNYLLLKIFAN